MPKVTLDGTNLSFEVNNEEVIYDALSDRGHDLPHGCLSGSCGACRVEIIEGNENLVPPSLVEANTIESLHEELKEFKGTMRLACRARVRGDVKIKPIP